MLYHGAELHNVARLVQHEDGGVSWLRIPQNVYDALEMNPQGQRMAENCTGVELRFVMNGDRVALRMAAEDGGRFHVYRGGIQGSWADHEVDKNIGPEPKEYVIERAPNAERLRRMGAAIGDPWSSDVVRVVFDLGRVRLYGIDGDIRPPRPEECPAETLLCYGSSISHGSNSIDFSHAWSSLIAQGLKMDLRNVAMAGSCAMEPEFADWLADEGRQGRWQRAILELGINVLHWPEEKMRERAENFLRQVAGRNPDKPVAVVSPFYCCIEELDGDTRPATWRKVLRELTARCGLPNVRYIDGLEILNGMEYISADEVHPNILGVARIAERLMARL